MRKTSGFFLVLAVFSLFFISGCIGNPCPAQQGQVYCGYCSDDRALTGNPNGGQCRYCPSGYSCSTSNICGELKCVPGGNGNGNTNGNWNNGANDGGNVVQQKTYYASCSQCKGAYSSYSYRGPSYDVCNAYYQTCVVAQCGKILDNCR